MKNLGVVLAFVSLVSFAACRTTAPPPEPVPSPTAATVERVGTLVSSDALTSAFAHVDRERDAILAEWRMLTEIEAPSGKEEQRAVEVERILRLMPSLAVSRDEVGNVIAVRKGEGGGPAVAVDAHLDTVFHEIAEVTTRVENGRVFGAGIGDNTRNVEAVLAMLRALDAAGVRTKGDLVATFTVEEETSFKGIDHLLATRGDAFDHFIALDGGFGGFTYGGTGTYWTRYHFLGPGGHTRSRTPPWSAALPLARSIDRLYALEIPSDPPTWLNVGMLGGSDVVNEKAEDAWFSLDVRSTDQQVLDRLDRAARAIAEEEAARAAMTVREEVVDKWPAAQIPGHRGSELVLTTQAVVEALGFSNPSITNTASNHSSAALRDGISAISTGTAPCGDAHVSTEWCEIEGFYRGIKVLTAITLAMTGVEEAVVSSQ